jgi:hypothetical protein
VDYVAVERHEIAETGEYNLEGPVHPFEPRGQSDQSKARCPRQHRSAFFRIK